MHSAESILISGCQIKERPLIEADLLDPVVDYRATVRTESRIQWLTLKASRTKNISLSALCYCKLYNTSRLAKVPPNSAKIRSRKPRKSFGPQ